MRQTKAVVTLVAMGLFLVSVLALLGVLLFFSPGTPKPFLDASGKPLAGSISEKIKVNINGLEQGMFIKGKNARNPVLLYLHGGLPDYFLTPRNPTGLEELFTIVWWEQRGSGLSYLKLRDVAMHELGVGTTHDMKSVVTEMFLPSLLFSEYTLSEKINLWRGKLFSGSRLWNTQLSTYLTKKVTRLDIPVYFFHGVYDYTVSYPLAKAYFEQLDAPIKGFYTFQQSAHTPFFEEPERTREIMQADVLKGTTGLADPASTP